MTRQQRFRILTALLFCFLIGVGIGCAADPCGDCPPGTSCVVPPAYGTLSPTGKLESVTPDAECVTLSLWGEGEAAHLGDGGLVIEDVDGGSCPLVPADAGPCAPCMLSACCAEATACFGDGGECSPTDPVGRPLAACITSSCAAQCPGVP
jgi:hypothetical protein